METRAGRKRKEAVVVVEKQHPKMHRVVLGELPNLPNLIVPENQNLSKQKVPCLKNPNIKKLSSPQIDPHYVSDINEYLRAMEVSQGFFLVLLFCIYRLVLTFYPFMACRPKEDQ